jgi:hypothetical protein
VQLSAAVDGVVDWHTGLRQQQWLYFTTWCSKTLEGNISSSRRFSSKKSKAGRSVTCVNGYKQGCNSARSASSCAVRSALQLLQIRCRCLHVHRIMLAALLASC